MEPQKRASLTTIVIIVVVLVVIVLAATVGRRFLPSSLVNLTQTVSPNILYLTQPVNTFSGKIDRVDSSSITVSQTVYLQSNPALPLAPPMPNSPTKQTNNQNQQAQSKTLTYTVNIGKNTTIAKMTSIVPYLFKANTNPAAPAVPVLPGNNQQLSLKDLKAGQTVSIVSSQDLRTLAINQFDAVSVTVQASNSILSGVINEVKSSSVVVNVNPAIAAPGLPGSNTQQQTNKQVEVTVDANTEISRNNFSSDPAKPSKPERLSLSDLQKGMQVTVYTDTDSSAQNPKALLIQPMLLPIVPAGGPALPNPASTSAGVPPAPPIPPVGGSR